MQADVCLLVEGTYPYVTGGVSSWVHSLITNLPDVRFAVVHIDANPDLEMTFRYPRPKNVIEFREIFVHNPGEPDGPDLEGPKTNIDRSAVHQLHELWNSGRREGAVELLCQHVMEYASKSAALELIQGEASWTLLQEHYEARAPLTSFPDYFWTYRLTHMPLYSVLAEKLPLARMYHATSTGYAGFAGAIAKARTGSPFIVTEHGIYTKEREIEIGQTDWIYDEPAVGPRLRPDLGPLRQWWLEMFRFMSLMAYRACDRLISLTAENQRLQLQDGADRSKMLIVPNGIDIARFGAADGHSRVSAERFTVGFVGRVVPIKDVKTLLKAVKIASTTIPNLLVEMIGPLDEDPQYYEECRQLMQLLGLDKIVRFTGPSNVSEHYPNMDALVLASLSEAQPLVILEASCAGIPVVATDVDACREMLEGITPDDRILGPSGLITRPASASETAAALVRLWSDPLLRERLGQSGRERVRRFYREESVYNAYRDIYAAYLHHAPSVVV